MLTHCGTQPIKTERLLLRAFAMEDAPCVHANWAGDEAVQRWYREPVYATLEETQDLLAKYIAACEKEDCYRWGVFEKVSGECIGQVAYFHVDCKNHYGEIEYCIGQAWQRRGYCSEAVRAIMRFGFEKVNLHKVQITHMAGNEASRGVILKCDLTYEGTLRDYFCDDGIYTDRLYYSMLECEWRGRDS